MNNELQLRIGAIRQRIAEACKRAGRDPGKVQIIAVAKTKPVQAILAVQACGLVEIGENYVQELVEKHRAIGDGVRWHFIGHLQRNKVKYLAPFVGLVHGVDSLRLAEEINRQAAQQGRTIPVLLQVNTSGEESKFGVEPTAALALAEELLRLPNIRLEGLMTLAAFLDDPEAVRRCSACFAKPATNFSSGPGIRFPTFPWGCTNDFEVAIEEGATMVRIGTAIFGEREYDDD
ncbi:MAG: TIM-barrel fold protein [Chlorobi bacterium OLB7]|nr:MAG: TIM-barrel fold protein [Chlorobi bacterium OLB7]